MAGSALAVGIVAACAAGAVALAVVTAAAVGSQRLAGAADSAALAAADAASGAISGYPCERAAEVAAVLGAQIDSCELDRLVATVTVSAEVLGLRVEARSRAGPPP